MPARPKTRRTTDAGSGILWAAAMGIDCCQLSPSSFKLAESTIPSAVKSPSDHGAFATSGIELQGGVVFITAGGFLG